MRIVLYDEVSTADKEKETEDLLYDEVPTADKEKEAEGLLYDEVPTAAKEKEAEGQGQAMSAQPYPVGGLAVPQLTVLLPVPYQDVL